MPKCTDSLPHDCLVIHLIKWSVCAHPSQIIKIYKNRGSCVTYLCMQNNFTLISESARVISVAACPPSSSAPPVDLIISPILGEPEELTNKLNMLPLLNRRGEAHGRQNDMRGRCKSHRPSVVWKCCRIKNSFALCSFAHFQTRGHRSAVSHSLHVKHEE